VLMRASCFMRLTTALLMEQVVTAVQKAVLDGKRSLVKVPLNKDNSFPHRIDGYFGASKVRDAAIEDLSLPCTSRGR